MAALALHLGGAALAVAHLASDEPDDSLGAPAIEIGLEMTSPRLEPTDLPPGPDTDASVASPALAEQKAEVKETELPKDTPTETDDPDRVVTPNEPRSRTRTIPRSRRSRPRPRQESVAAEATATPSLDNARKDSARSRLRKGTGESAQRVRATWQKELMAHLDKHKRYPAERAQKSAEIVVGFVLDRMGHVLSTSIVKGSGDAAFDEAALPWSDAPIRCRRRRRWWLTRG